jgi:hypothetical protein
MAGAPLARQQNSYSISRRAEAGLTVLDAQCISTREVSGKNSEKAMEALRLIDDIEQAIERQRDLSPELRLWYIAKLDELRALTR